MKIPKIPLLLLRHPFQYTNKEKIMGQKDIAEKRLEAYNDVFHLSEARAKAYLKDR